MVDGFKVVILIGAGRKKLLRQTIKSLMVQGDCIDEIHLWENTSIQSDLDYIQECESSIDKVLVKRCDEAGDSQS